MPFVQSSAGGCKSPVNLYFEDYGHGEPLVFIHGWPLSGSMWEHQVLHFTKAGYRCITYDRRGFGKSDYTYEGYDYDHLAEDLHSLLEHLDLKGVTLIGFSMGGGEVARYIGKYGETRLKRAVFIGAVTPYLLKDESNPNGAPKEVFEGMLDGLKADRPKFLAGFNKSFYGKGTDAHPVSDELLQVALMRGMTSGFKATLDCVEAFGYTDFREDLKKITIPTLVIHGDADEQVPYEKSAERMPDFVPHTEMKKYKGGRHGLFITDRTQLHADLEAFLKN